MFLCYVLPDGQFVSSACSGKGRDSMGRRRSTFLSVRAGAATNAEILLDAGDGVGAAVTLLSLRIVL